MKQRVTISFVEDEYEGRVLSRDFWDAVVRDEATRWCHGFSEINVSVEPVAASRDESTPLHSHVADFLEHHGDEYFEEPRGNGYVAWLRKHYGCDDGGAQ